MAIIGSLAAREVFVSTIAMTSGSDADGSLPSRLDGLERGDGAPVFDPATVAALLVFFVYALQCISTVAVLRRETNSWKWPAAAVASMFALAYPAVFTAHYMVGLPA